MTPKIPAKKETIQYLYDSMGATIVDLSGELRAVSLLSTESNRDCEDEHLSQNIRDLRNGLYFICIDLCSLMRAEIRAKNNIEKRFYFKTVFSTIREGFVFVYGFNDKQRKKSLWNEFAQDVTEATKQDCQEITNSLISLGENLEARDIKKIRDLSLHYDECMVAVYDLTISLDDEEEIALLVCNFLAIIKDILKYIQNLKGVQVSNNAYCPIMNFELPINTAFGNALVKNVILVNAIDQNIKQASDRLDFFRSKYAKCDQIEHYLKSIFEGDTVHNDFEPFDLVINIMMILDFMRAELGSLIISYLNSESEIEHKLLIRRIYVIKTSTLRLLYGYDDSETAKSMWFKSKTIIPSSNTYLLSKATSIEEKIKQEIAVDDRGLRALFVHLSEKGKSNVPKLLETLDYINPAQVFQSACNLVKLCPSINSYILELMGLISSRQKEKTLETRNKIADNFNKFCESIQTSKLNESQKEHFISSLKDAEDKLSHLLDS